MCYSSDHVNEIVEQLSTLCKNDTPLVDYSTNRAICMWLTQEKGKSFAQCLEAVVKKLGSLADPNHALRIAVVLGRAIHCLPKGHSHDVCSMLLEEWGNEMQC
jgi:hypothetical protein